MDGTLVIGIGNPLRGDDGLGWRAVEALRQMPSLKAAETVICHQLTPELAETVAQARRVIFIDACVGTPPGAIRVNLLPPAPSQDSAWSHRLDPRGLMQYSRRLYGVWPEAWTISMTGGAYDYSEGLSTLVESRLPALLEVAAE